ncbi:hypothetical protein ACIPK4_36780, partial [Streptomyces sp. NPDC086989]
MSMKRSAARAAATLAIAGLASTAAAIPAQATAPATATATTLAAATVSSSAVGGSITRSEVIERAKYWLGKSLTYNQGGSYPDSDGKYYRTDCSGYVSMAWHLTSSLNTVGIGDSADTHEISRSQLKAGDVLNSYYDHVILFDKWDDDAHTKFSYYSFGSTPVKHVTGMSINASTIDGHPNGDYKALRYGKIVDGSASGVSSPVSMDAGATHVAFVDGNGSVANDWVSNGAWQGPAGIGGKARADSPVVLNASADHAFFIDADGNVMNDWVSNGAWQGPSAIGGKARPGSPIATNAAGTLVTFVDTNGNVVSDAVSNGAWQGPTALGGKARG